MTEYLLHLWKHNIRIKTLLSFYFTISLFKCAMELKTFFQITARLEVKPLLPGLACRLQVRVEISGKVICKEIKQLSPELNSLLLSYIKLHMHLHGNLF